MTQPNPHIGTSFESLDEEGILEECTATAIKRVLARQIERAMHERGLTKSAMAKAMRPAAATRPPLDPANPSVTLTRCSALLWPSGASCAWSWPDGASHA